MLFSSSKAPRLVQHLHVLYPLAQVLVGPEDAGALLRQAYEKAVAVPASERPENTEEWLIQLLIDAQNGPVDRPDAETVPDADARFEDGPFRRDIAEQVAHNKLPVAFASCSLRERLILAVDALTDSSDDVLRSAIGKTASDASSLRKQAHSTLRASLRDVLTGPERMLIDVALPDDALDAVFHTFLTDQFQSAPASVRSDITDIVESASPGDAPKAPSASGPSFLAAEWVDALRQWMNSRLGRIGGLAALLIVALLGSNTFLSTTSAPSSTNVVDLSIQNASTLDVTQSTPSPTKAAAYIRDTWDRHLTVPAVQHASIQGIDRLSLSDSSTAPVLIYSDDDSGDRIAAYAFNYALLNQSGPNAVLEASLRTGLATPDTLLGRQRPDYGVVLWRHRDDIFVVTAPNTSPDALRSRVQP